MQNRTNAEMLIAHLSLDNAVKLAGKVNTAQIWAVVGERDLERFYSEMSKTVKEGKLPELAQEAIKLLEVEFAEAHDRILELAEKSAKKTEETEKATDKMLVESLVNKAIEENDSDMAFKILNATYKSSQDEEGFRVARKGIVDKIAMSFDDAEVVAAAMRHPHFSQTKADDILATFV